MICHQKAKTHQWHRLPLPKFHIGNALGATGLGVGDYAHIPHVANTGEELLQVPGTSDSGKLRVRKAKLKNAVNVKDGWIDGKPAK